MMFPIPLITPPWRLIAALAVVTAAVAALVWFGVHKDSQGYARAKGEYEAVIQEQKIEALRELQEQTAKTFKVERELEAFKDQQEREDADHGKRVESLGRRLADLATRNGGRLRDPKAGRGGSGGGAKAEAAAAPGDSGANPGQAMGVFSVPASNDLRRLLREADELNIAYTSCRADALMLREKLNKER